MDTDVALSHLFSSSLPDAGLYNTVMTVQYCNDCSIYFTPLLCEDLLHPSAPVKVPSRDPALGGALILFKNFILEFLRVSLINKIIN